MGERIGLSISDGNENWEFNEQGFIVRRYASSLIAG
jgi:nuclear transport factor 2 (NTF2) superfamily protein